MTQWQKAIKYAAMTLAILITVGIIGGIVRTVSSVAAVFDIGRSVTQLGDMKEFEVSGEISSLDVEIDGGDLKIKLGDGFAVESDIVDLSVRVSGGKLSISEKSKLFGFKKAVGTVILTIPGGTVFDRASIEMGAGRLDAEAISAKHLSLELGAGEVNVKSLTAVEKAEIDGGAGKITVEGGAINALDLDMGMGELELTSALSGRCELDLGIGATKLTLIGTEDDYSLSLDKGIGAVKLNGSSISSGTRGNGEVKVDVDCGIGEVNIEIKEQAE